MSGGSYDYCYSKIDELYVGRMHDIELDEMMSDLVEVLHDLEWWKSGDCNENEYRKTVEYFKKKWFKRDEIEIKKIINKRYDQAKDELLKTFSYLNK